MNEQDRKAVEEYIEKLFRECQSAQKRGEWWTYSPSDSERDFLAGLAHARKELEQVAREAFEAGRVKVGHPDWDYAFEAFSDYWKKKTESKEGE